MPEHAHLTNYAINKDAADFKISESDIEAGTSSQLPKTSAPRLTSGPRGLGVRALTEARSTPTQRATTEQLRRTDRNSFGAAQKFA